MVKNFFNLFKKQSEKSEKNILKPKYIKPDGTKVIEQENELGLSVYEIKPDCTVISRTYDKKDKLLLDYIRRRNLEIGHQYDEDKRIIYEFNNLYDEHNVLAKKYEINYEYDDDGNKIKETTILTPENIKTEITFDKNGKQIEKIEKKGSIKTWYNSDGKPIKRQIDKGSGGIINEDLS